MNEYSNDINNIYHTYRISSIILLCIDHSPTWKTIKSTNGFA